MAPCSVTAAHKYCAKYCGCSTAQSTAQQAVAAVLPKVLPNRLWLQYCPKYCPQCCGCSAAPPRAAPEERRPLEGSGSSATWRLVALMSTESTTYKLPCTLLKEPLSSLA
jgi:hypothetical protein